MDFLVRGQVSAGSVDDEATLKLKPILPLNTFTQFWLGRRASVRSSHQAIDCRLSLPLVATDRYSVVASRGLFPRQRIIAAVA